MEKSKGISLDYMAGYYDMLTPAEKSAFRKKQIKLVGLQEGEKVLEAGCGTAALSILAKLGVGENGSVYGIDIAEKMINKAGEKANACKLNINFQKASIANLPFSDGSFDVVISSMMFHHLPVNIKEKGLQEIYRVLKKEGRLYLADFCTPGYLTAPLMLLMFIWMVPTRFQLLGKLPALIAKTGFKNIKLIKKGFFLKHYIIKK